MRPAAIRAPGEGRLRVAREARAADEHGLASGPDPDTHGDPLAALRRPRRDDKGIQLPHLPGRCREPRGWPLQSTSWDSAIGVDLRSKSSHVPRKTGLGPR